MMQKVFLFVVYTSPPALLQLNRCLYHSGLSASVRVTGTRVPRRFGLTILFGEELSSQLDHRTPWRTEALPWFALGNALTVILPSLEEEARRVFRSVVARTATYLSIVT